MDWPALPAGLPEAQVRLFTGLTVQLPNEPIDDFKTGVVDGTGIRISRIAQACDDAGTRAIRERRFHFYGLSNVRALN